MADDVKTKLLVINELQSRGVLKPWQAHEFRTRVQKSPKWNEEGGLIDTKILENLPLAGGIAGGVLGGIAGGTAGSIVPFAGTAAGAGTGSVMGAGLGGAAGESLRGLGKHLIGSRSAPTTLQNLQNMGRQAVTQGTYAAGGEIGGQMIGRGLQGLAKYTPVLKARASGAVESIPGVGGWVKGARQFKEGEAKSVFDLLQQERRAAFDAAEQGRKIAYGATKEGVKADIKALPAKGRVDAAAGLQESVNKTAQEISQQYDEVVKPVINKYANQTIRGQEMRDALLKPLRENGFVDAKGNILRNEMESIKTPELKKYYNDLADWVDDLTKNPTFRQADRIRTDIQNAAFKQNRPMYAGVAHDFRVGMMDNLEAIAGTEGKALATARKAYAEVKPVMDELTKIAEQYPNQIAARARSQMPGEFIKDAIVKVPKLKQPIADVVANDLIRSADTPKVFTEAIDKYERDTLQQLFDKKTFDAILEYERKLALASQPFKPSKFIPQKMPPKPLGKVWSAIKATAEKGGKINPAYVRVLFQNMANSIGGGTNDQR